MEPLYSTEQVAALLGRPAVTVRKAARDHGIGVKIGKSRGFTAADIERLRGVIRDHRGRPPRSPKKE